MNAATVTDHFARERVLMARSALLISQPFFGTLALGLEPVECAKLPDGRECTMATDAVRLFYNPAFVATLSDRQLQGLWAHEVCHVSYKHAFRRNGRDFRLWNEAGDYAINRDITAAGFEIAPGMLLDKRFDGLGTDEIYRTLNQARPKEAGGGAGKAGKPDAGAGGKPASAPGNAAQPGKAGTAGAPGGKAPANGGKAAGEAGKPSGGGNGGDPGKAAPGEVLDAAPGGSEAANSQIEADWDAKVRQAVAVAKAAGAGKVPASIAGLVEAMAAPRIDWRAELRRFLDASVTKDYSWTRPNRRHIGAGRILPGYVPDRPAHIVAMVDTSGSIAKEDLESFSGELQAMLDDGATDRITVAFADTRVHRSESYEAGDAIRLTAVGRGGTDFRAPLAWIEENAPDASAVVYMTDCDVTQWGEPPAAPVLWLVTGEPRRARALASRAPFGEAIIQGD